MPRPKRDVLLDERFTPKQVLFIETLRKELDLIKNPTLSADWIEDYDMFFNTSEIIVSMWRDSSAVKTTGRIGLKEVDKHLEDVQHFAAEKVTDFYNVLVGDYKHTGDEDNVL